jgi:hypothetical protein
MQNKYLIKDLKHSDIYAYAFSPKYNNYRDIEFTKADLVMDSCILSDFTVISYDLSSTCQIQSMINGLALLPCLFLYAMLINEFKFIDLVTLI